ncbi:DUF5615 family PIN-like protein [Bacteroidota bacterium]
MKIWLDAQLSPLIAKWIRDEFQIEITPLRDLALRNTPDREIFFQAKQYNAMIMTKDHDFIDLISQYGSPPQILLLTCGNTSNKNLKVILKHSFKMALKHIQNGESIVEISDNF